MKKKFLWIGIFGTLVVGLIALGYSVTADSRVQASKLESLRDEAGALGIPTTLDGAEPASVPDESNAALLIIQASEKLDLGSKIVADLMVEASRLPQCVFPWPDVDSGAFWQGLRFSDCIDALLAQAEQDYEADDMRGFQRRLHAAMLTSRIIAVAPSVLAFRESVSAERQVYVWMGAFMTEHPGSAQVMPMVQAETFDKRGIKSLLVAFHTSIAEGHEIASGMDVYDSQKLKVWEQSDFPSNPWGRDAVVARHLEEWIRLFKDIDAAQSWTSVMDILEARADEWESTDKPASYTVRLSAQRIRGLGSIAAENEAARRILFVAAGAFRHRQSKNQFPQSSPVRGEMEIDPFTQKQMLFANPGSGFYLYSIGADKLDAGGTMEEGLTFNSDVGFRFKSWDPPKTAEQREAH